MTKALSSVQASDRGTATGGGMCWHRDRHSRGPIDWPEVVPRRLVAVAFADVAGFSARMERDDVRTIREWTMLLEHAVRPGIAEHNGDLLHVIGDGVLVGFQSAVDAVRWALELQRRIAGAHALPGATRLSMRIGINVEDALVGSHDLHGNGVNIASRIQQLARPGEVVTTAAVREYVSNKLPVRFDDLGEQRLRNISRRIHVYRVAGPSDRRGSVMARAGLLRRLRPAVSAALGMALGFLLALAYLPPNAGRQVTPVIYDQASQGALLAQPGRDTARRVLERSSPTLPGQAVDRRPMSHRMPDNASESPSAE